MPEDSTQDRSFDSRSAFFTWANIVSLSRLFVAFPIMYLHYHNGLQPTPLVIAFIVYGILSDYLDGILARRSHRITEWGKVLDPVADKLTAMALFAYTVWLEWIPLWFFVVVVGRDVLIMCGSLLLKKKAGVVPPSVWSGKVSVNMLALYWLVVFFLPGAGDVHLVLMGMSLSLMIYSFFDYLQRFWELSVSAPGNGRR